MSNDPVILVIALLVALVAVLIKGSLTLALQAGTDPLNFVQLLVALISLIAGLNIAHLVGPYAAIFVLACCGAIMSLTGSDKEMTIGQGVWYVTFRVVLAWGLTVSVAELLETGIPWAKPRYTLVPIALGIGYIRDYAHLVKIKGQVVGFIGWLRKKDV